MKIWPPFVLISLRKEHFYGNAAAELRALFKRVKWCMLWPKMHSLSLHLEIVSLYLLFERLLIQFFQKFDILRQLPSEMALVLCARVKSGQFCSLQRGSKYELIYQSILPCANFFIFYIYYLHMWSSCVMAFLVKRKIFLTCTAKKFDEILHGQTYSNKNFYTFHSSNLLFITIFDL